MVDASAQPHIVVTLEPNPWAAFYFDINIANTGNAPAYNVEVVFDPPLVNAEHREKSEIPFSKVSVLKNGQLKWFTEFGHLNRGDMLTSEQHRCHNEKKKFQRRV